MRFGFATMLVCLDFLLTGCMANVNGSDRPSAAGARALHYQVAAEGYARDRSCTSNPKAVLVAYGGSTETYMIECSNGPPLVTRCDYATCREVK